MRYWLLGMRRIDSLESDILMEKCGRKEQNCDIVIIDLGQLAMAAKNKSSARTPLRNTCS
jgi:hypothetical protein